MGSVICLLNFALKSFHGVAWPIFAFIYPLYASIQVMETKSTSPGMHRIVSYWISFSVIMLVGACSWIPFWTSMRLSGVFCLVLLDFSGSSYVYEHFVRQLIGAHNKYFKLFANRINSSTESLKEINESQRQNSDVMDIKAVDKELLAVDNNVKNTSVDQNEVLSAEPLEIDEIESSPVMVEPLEVENSPGSILTDEEKTDLKSKGISMVGNGKSWHCIICEIYRSKKKSINGHLSSKEHKRNVRELKSKGVEIRDSLWWCIVCDVRCGSRSNMEEHLNGKKHLANSQQLIIYNEQLLCNTDRRVLFSI